MACQQALKNVKAKWKAEFSLVPNRRGVGISGGVGKISKTYKRVGWNCNYRIAGGGVGNDATI